VRLPGLCERLAALPKLGEGWPLELYLLRGALAAAPPTPTPEAGFLEAIRDDPADAPAWKIYSDWLQDQGVTEPAGVHLLRGALTRVSAYSSEFLRASREEGELYHCGGELGDAWAALRWLEDERPDTWREGPSRSQIHVSEHVAQLCLHFGQCFWTERDSFHQWFFFDDVWASAHPDLANALLTYARRWDALSG
jgi:uncharacterized protein (TIGR02996 family)